MRPLLRKAYLGGVCGSSAECKPSTTGQTVVYASISAMFACCDQLPYHFHI